MVNDKRASKRCTQRTHETVLHALETFLEQELKEASQLLRTDRTIYRIRCTPRNECFERTRHLQKFLDRKVQQLDQLTVKRVETKARNFWQNVGKVYKTDVSQGTAPLKKESGYFIKTASKTNYCGKSSSWEST